MVTASSNSLQSRPAAALALLGVEQSQDLDRSWTPGERCVLYRGAPQMAVLHSLKLAPLSCWWSTCACTQHTQMNQSSCKRTVCESR
jgi:hypothetical protein